MHFVVFRLAIFVIAALAPGVASAQPRTSVCNDAELVFVGRAEAPVTFRVSGEAEIERARQNLVRAEEQLKKERESLDFWTQLFRAREFAVRLVNAQRELNMRRAMYPKPYEVTFIPLAVVRPFRGVSEASLMLHVRPELPLQAGDEYLVYGARSKNVIPPFPEMGDLAALADYVESYSVIPVASAQQHLQFLASTGAGGTVMGTLRMHTFGEGLPAPIGGVRIVVSSSNQAVETITREDGEFVATGVKPGDLDITAALGSDLTLVGRPTHKPSVRDGGCTAVALSAAVNGRVRGRVFSAQGASLHTIELQLRVARANRRMSASHDPHFSTTARADGTFEFSGVSAGTYLLDAWVRKPDGVPTTYYPGTDDLDAATPIVVGKGTLHEGFDFVVSTQPINFEEPGRKLLPPPSPY
ncbi:MAG TPA: carboxypeptidase-like regulatory domain-containing protein [Vicinamibacterales bacterium]|nr:carboxypeptidase-like regulatory domain-containing protein [Vicinamibacterales bacterium]